MALRKRLEKWIAPRNSASMRWRDVLLGGGVFDTSGDHPNKKGWEIFELGQKSFWAVPGAIPWDEPIRENPEYAEHIAAMLTFLCPGEKAAVTGASYVSNLVRSEEAKFYFAEQALEEAKHYDAMRRLIPKITGRPMDPPSFWVRFLFSFGVVDRDDVAFMMGNINIVGEHLANQILHRVNHVAIDPSTRKLLSLIGKDESRHIAAGQKFFIEVFPEYERNHRKIMAKNLATSIVLAFASYDLVNPMRALNVDLVEIMEAMYKHYSDVTNGLPAFPEQAILEKIVTHLRKQTPVTIARIQKATDETGKINAKKLVAMCEEAIKSPRVLRDVLENLPFLSRAA
jgi:rubrerythrin